MIRHGRNIVSALAFVAGLLLLAAGSLRADDKAQAPQTQPAAAKIRVVVLTGGHGFDQKKFAALFSGHDDIQATIVTLKDDSETFEDITNWPYDVIVLYNMTQKISPKRQANFVALLDRGVGLVVMHHAFANYLGWPEFKRISGVRFYLGKAVDEGVTHAGSGARHVPAMKVHVEDPKHPITAGVTDFTIAAEPYKNQWMAEDNHVLLTTDSPASDKALAWVRTYRKARVFAIEPGHGPALYADANYRRLIAQAIRWVARRTGQDAEPPAKAPAKAAQGDKGAAGQTEPAPDPTAAIQKARTYEFGQSRKDLVAAEKAINDSAGKPAQLAACRKALLALLASDSSRDAKAWACKQLGLVGQAQDVPAIAKLLADKDLSHMARTALEGIGGPPAAAALRDALDSVQGLGLVGVINSLANLKDAKAAGALGKLAATGTGQVAEAAIRALGDIGGQDAQDALDQAAAKAPPELKAPVIDARLKLAESLLAQGNKDRATRTYEDLFGKGNPAHVRSAALAGLVAARGAGSVPMLLEMLTDSDPAMQALAAGHVRAIPGTEALRALAVQLPKLTASGQVALIRALAGRQDAAGQADVVQAVAKAAQSPEASVRIEALEAVGVLGDASAVKMLAEAAAGPDPAAGAARAALARLRDPGVDAKIVACMDGAPANVCAELIRSLAVRRAADAAPALLKLAEGTDATLAGEALKALIVLADEKCLPSLVKLMIGAKDAERRGAAASAVEAVCKRISDKDAAAAPLLAELPKAQGAVKVALLNVLGRIGGPKALVALRAAAKDPDADVQDAGVRALTAWAGPEVADDLLAIARESANPAHRVLALRGYVRLIGASVRPAAEAVAMYKAALSAAGRAEDKKMILGNLGQRDDLESLSLVADLFGAKDVQAEAFAAALKIASACSGSFPKEVQAGLDKLIAATADPNVRRQAQAIIEETKGQLRVAVNFAGEGVATSPDDVEKDGASGGDAAAIDGDPATYWDETDGQKLYRLVVTFDQPRAMGGISILGYQQHSFAPKDFEVLCDGKAVSTVRDAQYEDNLLVVVFPETQCKALELKITGYYGQSPAIRELGIYGRKAVGATPAQLKTPVKSRSGQMVTLQKVKQLPNGAWIVREVASGG